MTIEKIQSILGWCIIFNFSFMMLWFSAFMFSHQFIYQLHHKFFKMTEEHFNCIHYAGLAFYKGATFFFCIFPYLALKIIFASQ